MKVSPYLHIVFKAKPNMLLLKLRFVGKMWGKNILTGCTSLLNLWYLSDNQSKMAPVVPFLIDWVEFRQEYLPVMSKDL